MPCTSTPRAASGSAIRPGADPELERAAAARELGQEVDGRLDLGGRAHRAEVLVVAGGDLLAELVLGHDPGRY